MNALNQAQWMSLLRSILTLVGGVLIAKGLLTNNQVGTLLDEITGTVPALIAAVSLLIPLITTIWGLFRHEQKAVIKEVAAMPGVEKIVVAAPIATPAIREVAADPSVPNVVLSIRSTDPKAPA